MDAAVKENFASVWNLFLCSLLPSPVESYIEGVCIVLTKAGRSFSGPKLLFKQPIFMVWIEFIKNMIQIQNLEKNQPNTTVGAFISVE